MSLDRAVAVAKSRAPGDNIDPAVIDLMEEMRERKRQLDPEQQWFANLCDRWDNLYFPQGFTAGGASHWADHESARLPGRSHVSVNAYPVYVDVPASLQAVTPIENMVAAVSDSGKVLKSKDAVTSAIERMFFAWKASDKFELKGHEVCVVKELYGRTAGKVYWDDEENRVCIDVVDQPRNLWLGWKNSDYRALEWALYVYRITPQTALEDWGLVVGRTGDADDPDSYPIVVNPTSAFDYSGPMTAYMTFSDLQVEVYDYWYRRPAKGAKARFGKPTKFETWNAVFVGNALVANVRHPEYNGKMPYVPLMNTYIPGRPDGRPALYDIEQLIREKDERMSENSQMMSNAVNGQYWQVTGPEAPLGPVSNLKPVRNGVIGTGPGNRLEAITPWMPEFQMEAYLSRIDRELADVSGLNDLLRGMAPSGVLDSGKAIAALVANYETRIRMKRDLYYEWRLQVWDLVVDVWSDKVPALKAIFETRPRLDIVPPSLTPRDDAEVATIAVNLKENKVISAKRAMDRVGVDDPETEQDIIRDEQTDATLNPAAVQVMAQLLGILRAQGIQPQPQVEQAAGQQAQALSDVRALAPGQQGQPQLNSPDVQPQVPGDQMPGNTPAGAAAGANGPVGANPLAPVPAAQDTTLQTAIRGGAPASRILQQQKVTQQPSGGG